MKREEVKGILPGITDEQLEQIMDLHGADIERQKQSIAALTTERDAARDQLGEANAKLEKALDACTRGENAMVVGPKEGQHSASEFVEYLISAIEKL